MLAAEGEKVDRAFINENDHQVNTDEEVKMLGYLCLTALGAGLFGYSLVLFRKSEDSSSLKIYGAFAYAGVFLFVLGLGQLVCTYLYQSFTPFPAILLFAVFAFAASRLLKPGAKKEKEETATKEMPNTDKK